MFALAFFQCNLFWNICDYQIWHRRKTVNHYNSSLLSLIMYKENIDVNVLQWLYAAKGDISIFMPKYSGKISIAKVIFFLGFINQA